MAKKKVVEKSVVPVPTDKEEANRFLGQLGELERTIQEATAQMNREIEEMKTRYVKQVAPLESAREDLVQGLYTYASRNRAELTADGSKTVRLPNGTLSWRMTPKSVALKGVDAILEHLKATKGLKRFIRVKEEVDKEAMLKDEDVAAGIRGVTINQHEEFVVKPSTTSAELTATQGRNALKIALAGPKKKKAAKNRPDSRLVAAVLGMSRYGFFISHIYYTEYYETENCDLVGRRGGRIGRNYCGHCDFMASRYY